MPVAGLSIRDVQTRILLIAFYILYSKMLNRIANFKYLYDQTTVLQHVSYILREALGKISMVISKNAIPRPQLQLRPEAPIPFVLNAIGFCSYVITGR